MTKGENTRQFIIEKAALLLNQKGVAGTAISDIMEATSLTKGGIYRNFDSKDEICLEAFGYLSKRLSASIDAEISGKANSKDKLFTLLDFYHDKLVLNDRGGCPMLNFGTDADDTNPVLKQRVAEAITVSQARIQRIVKAGVEDGTFQKSANPEHFAVKMFAMLEGAILASRVFNHKHQMKIVTDFLKSDIEALCT